MVNLRVVGLVLPDLLIFQYYHLTKHIFKDQTGPEGHMFVTQPQTHLRALLCSHLLHLFLHQFLKVQGHLHMPPTWYTFPDILESLLHQLWHVWLVLLSRNVALLSSLHEDTCLSSLTNYELEAMDHSFLSLSPNPFTNALY